MQSALITRLLIAILCLLAAAKPILYDTMDPDAFWHLQVARQLRAEGVGPLIDHLAAGSIKTPWTPYSWLAELGMLRAWELGGFRAAVLVHALCAAAIIALIAWTVRCSTAPLVGQTFLSAPKSPSEPEITSVILPTLFAAFLTLPYLSFRPATLALVLLALVFALITRDRITSGRALWLAVPITALLANIHLYAFLVPIWFACLAVEHRRYFCFAIATAIASCMTPMLGGMLRTIFHYQFNDPLVASGVIAEMQPFWRGPMGMVCVGIVAATVFTILYTTLATPDRHPERSEGSSQDCEGSSIRPPGWMFRFAQHDGMRADWLLLAVSMALLLMKGRYAPLFAIATAPMLARSLVPSGEKIHPGRRVAPSPAWMRRAAPLIVTTIILTLLLKLFLAFPSANTSLDQWLNRYGPDVPGYPTAAASYVDAHIPPQTGVLINEFTWGGYLGWRLAPRFTPIMDGRTQCFSPDFWQHTYLSPTPTLPTNADAAILPKGKSLFRQTLQNAGWILAHEDDWAQVWQPMPGFP